MYTLIKLKVKGERAGANPLLFFAYTLVEAYMADKMQALTDLLTPVVEASNMVLYDIALLREGGERILRIYIDTQDANTTQTYVTIDDCERVSHAAEAVLDEHEPITGAYALEVSSPGIERKLSKEAHFARYVGHNIRLRLYAPVENRKNFHGKLMAFQDDVLTIESETTWQFPRAAVASCRLAVFED